MKKIININDAAFEKVNGGGLLDHIQMSDEDRASFTELEKRYWATFYGRWKGTHSDADWYNISNEMKSRVNYLLGKYAA